MPSEPEESLAVAGRLNAGLKVPGKKNAKAASHHTTQYFEMMGQWALYKDGWMLWLSRSFSHLYVEADYRSPGVSHPVA